jgi:hypothetical protein
VKRTDEEKEAIKVRIVQGLFRKENLRELFDREGMTSIQEVERFLYREKFYGQVTQLGGKILRVRRKRYAF